jgi:hypothetical protein
LVGIGPTEIPGPAHESHGGGSAASACGVLAAAEGSSSRIVSRKGCSPAARRTVPLRGVPTAWPKSASMTVAAVAARGPACGAAVRADRPRGPGPVSGQRRCRRSRMRRSRRRRHIARGLGEGRQPVPEPRCVVARRTAGRNDGRPAGDRADVHAPLPEIPLDPVVRAVALEERRRERLLEIRLHRRSVVAREHDEGVAADAEVVEERVQIGEVVAVARPPSRPARIPPAIAGSRVGRRRSETRFMSSE